VTGVVSHPCAVMITLSTVISSCSRNQLDQPPKRASKKRQGHYPELSFLTTNGVFMLHPITAM